MSDQESLFESLGVNTVAKKEMNLDSKWLVYSLNHNTSTSGIPILLIKRGPKTVAEMRNRLRGISTCIVFFEEKNALLLKSLDNLQITTLENDSEYERIISIFNSTGISDAQDEFDLKIEIQNAIDKIPNATSDFVNHGLFSTHYLRRRIFEDTRQNVDSAMDVGKERIGDAKALLEALGWDISNSAGTYFDGAVSITVTEQDDFGIRQNKSDAVPSYAAVATLRKSHWAILTNGKRWRLYSSRVSASSTNYFEITLDPQYDSITRYLVVLFGAEAYRQKDGRTDIDEFFEQGRNYSTGLEENLSERIMRQNGLFLDIIKGILDHDMNTAFTADELDSAKQTALKVMYRIWFLAYAESRNLLPTKDERYKPISLQTIRNTLDSFEQNDDDSCWNSLLHLFAGVRDGSPKHNLPQYNGNLFRKDPCIDDISIRNEFLTSALRGLLEQDGESIDYTNLGVRHLGNIFESLMEFSVRQAQADIMLVEDKDRVMEVKTKKESTYSYKKNDLYLVSKTGNLSRKTSASFYTPHKMVEFLVRKGLAPILEERENHLESDLQKYHESKNQRDRQTCIDRILDIQVLDPSMGSGHFLVEALNQITVWATEMLQKYSEHPLLQEIDADQKTVISAQKKKGISIDPTHLTWDVLLKRKIMKRCIFGVDLNPMAVDLAKLSLWLDSFAIGVPLTYLDHHIKHGDSTIGMWLKDRKTNVTDQTLDVWMQDAYGEGTALHDISTNADITIADVKKTKSSHDDYESKIKPYKKMLDVLAAKHIDKSIEKNAPRDLTLIFDTASRSGSTDSRHSKVIKQSSDLSKQLHFFHWELEMMDAFTDKRKGFDLLVTNPPWDKIRPNKNEFFSKFVPTYKNESAAKKKKTQAKYSDEFEEYNRIINNKRVFYKNRGGIGENTDFEIYRLIMERMVELLAPNGMMSILVPSAILGSRGAMGLRKHLLLHKIFSIYEFENKKEIFPIHKQTKFVLLTAQNTKSRDDISTAFYLYDADKLDTIDDEAFLMSKDTISTLSPNLSIICEMKEKKDLKIFKKLFSSHPRLENMEQWQITLGRELNLGEKKDRSLLTKKSSKSWPVIESKNFHQHMWNFTAPEHHADIRKTLQRAESMRKFEGFSKEIHENPRLAYRNVSGATNTRTMISSILPSCVFTALSTYMAIPKIGEIDVNPNYHRLNAYLCGIFNSMVFDYIIRAKVDKHVETYHIYDVVVPSNFTDRIASRIIKLSAVLFLSNTWHEDMADSIPLLKDDLPHLTVRKYIEIVSELDALVAIHYGLEHDEYAHVMNSFKFDDKEIPDTEMDQNLQLDRLKKGDRDKIMRKIFGHVRNLAPKFYRQHHKEHRK